VDDEGAHGDLTQVYYFDYGDIHLFLGCDFDLGGVRWNS
jgi:hypothetical protein